MLSVFITVILSISLHVINICRVSRWKSYFIVFHISKVGVGLTSPSEPVCHPFGNDAPYIKLWGASFWNCPAYFGQPENSDQHVLSDYVSSCVSFFCGFGSLTPLFSITLILGVWLENNRVMLPKSQAEDTWERM
jgi:hypothetical protein